MKSTNDDIFESVHRLMREGLFLDVINILCESSSGKIRKEFSSNRNHAWYCVADSKFRIGDFWGAIAAFKKSLISDPGDIQCFLAIANCYDALRKPKLAERFLRRALLFNPGGRTKAAICVNLGNALMDQRRWAEAVEYLKDPSRRNDDIGVIAKKNLIISRCKLKDNFPVQVRKS